MVAMEQRIAAMYVEAGRNGSTKYHHVCLVHMHWRLESRKQNQSRTTLTRALQTAHQLGHLRSALSPFSVIVFVLCSVDASISLRRSTPRFRNLISGIWYLVSGICYWSDMLLSIIMIIKEHTNSTIEY